MSIHDDIQRVLRDAITEYGHNAPRSIQSKAGIMGPSDLGFCRNKAALMTKGIPHSDVKSIRAAQLGTAIHLYLAEVFEWANPDHWLVEQRVTARFPSGVEISGSADLILTDWNALIDAKSTDGLEWVKREGISQNHKFQKHTYVLGAIAAGYLDESKPIYSGCLYIDRSGKEEPYLILEEFDPSLTDEIDSWIGDVIYAVKQGEDAMRDIPAPVCEKICEFYTVCRGDLPTEEGGEFIEDEMRVKAVDMFVEGRELEKRGAQMKREAGAILIDTNGVALVDGVRWQVRNTFVGPSRVESFEKQGYNRLDVRKLKS